MTSSSGSIAGNLGNTGGIQDNEDNTPDDVVAKLKDKELERKLGEWANSKYIRCKSDITPIRNQWYINLAFYKGDQYVSLQRGKLIRAPMVPGRVRLVVNKIRPAVRTEISRMTSQKPVANVVPASSEEEDVEGAEAGQAAWEYISATKGVYEAFRKSAFWLSVCGVSYVKAVWDDEVEDRDSHFVDSKDAIKPGGNDPDDNPPASSMQGDLCYSAPTPFHIMVPDSLEQDIQRQPFVLHIYTMTIEEVKDRWPDKIDPDHTPTVVSTNEIMETRYLNLVGTEQTAKPDSCLVIECWVKPNATNLVPDGGMFIVVDKQLVYKSLDGIPYKHGDFPFTKFENIDSGSYWTTSMIEDVIPLQKEINRSRSQIVENRNATAKSGYFVQQGAVDLNKWTSKPGQLIEIKPGFKEPVPIPIPPMPNYLETEKAAYADDIEDITGQHQVSKGNAPSGVTAATAINFLQERDDSYLAPVYASIEKGIQSVAWQSLQLAQQFWDEPRLIKTIGPDQSSSAKWLQGSDLKNGTDIRIETGSALPVSKAARVALVMDMMNRGFLPPAQGFDLMDLPNMQAFYDVSKVDERQAKRENVALAEVDPKQIQAAMEEADQLKQQYLQQHGFQDENQARTDPVVAQFLDKLDAPMLPVNDWDNDQVHIQFHENFMKSQRWSRLDPAIQQQFIKHDNAHHAKMQSKMLTQMMQGGTAGANGGPPTGGAGDPSPAAKGPNGGPNAQGQNQFSTGNAPVDAGPSQ